MSIENQNNNFQFYRIVGMIHFILWNDIYSKSKIIGRYLKANNFMGIIIPVLIGV
jgi:hypothetical protein